MTKHKYGRYYTSKEVEEEWDQVFKVAFKWIPRFFIGYIMLAASASIYASIYPPALEKSEERDIIDTCDEAKENLRYALDRRDAVTPTEATTPEGMEKWTKWRDKAQDVEVLALKLCPSGEPLLSQSSSNN